jgi:hypothetical protein
MRQSDLFRFGLVPVKKQSAPEKSPEKAPVIDTQSKKNGENPSPIKTVGAEPINLESPKDLTPIK